MREIKFDSKVYSHTKYAVDAIAWATNRRGHNRWEGDDVVNQVHEYLIRNNVKMETLDYRGRDRMLVGARHIERAMVRLTEVGLARIKRREGGTTIVSFEFEPDVILTGHSVDKNETGDPIDRLKEAAAEPRVASAITELVDMPMPELPFHPYRHDELTELLSSWQKRDGDAHADYIDRLIDTLKVVVNG